MLAKLKLCAKVAKARAQAFFSKEDGEVNIIAIVVLIGIAVLLAIVFRGYIENLLKMLFGQVNNNAKNAIGG
jgi:predicted exporter